MTATPALRRGTADGAPGSTPRPLIGLAPQLRRVLAGTDLAPLGEELLAATAADPEDAAALLDLSILMQFKDRRDLASALQGQALQLRQIYPVAGPRRPDALRLLAIMSPGDLMANTPVDCLVEDTDVTLDLLYAAPGVPFPGHVPDHDVAMVAVAESAANLPILQDLEPRLADWPRPVINRPRRIAALSRDRVSRLLRAAPGIDAPAVVQAPRHVLAALAAGRLAPGELDAGLAYPVIVRPMGSHACHGLTRCTDPAALAACLEAADADEFYISAFRDYRDADGRYRKYRIVLIGGRPFLSHLAVGDQWMLNYQNARMDDEAAKRAEEAAALERFDSDFARRHAAALRAVHQATGLDYVGIDCAQGRDGRLLIFEVDNAMVIHGMDAGAEFAYKRAAMRRVFSAFHDLLVEAARPAQAAGTMGSAPP